MAPAAKAAKAKTGKCTAATKKKGKEASRNQAIKSSSSSGGAPSMRPRQVTQC